MQYLVEVLTCGFCRMRGIKVHCLASKLGLIIIHIIWNFLLLLLLLLLKLPGTQDQKNRHSYKPEYNLCKYNRKVSTIFLSDILIYLQYIAC